MHNYLQNINIWNNIYLYSYKCTFHILQHINVIVSHTCAHLAAWLIYRVRLAPRFAANPWFPLFSTPFAFGGPLFGEFRIPTFSYMGAAKDLTKDPTCISARNQQLGILGCQITSGPYWIDERTDVSDNGQNRARKIACWWNLIFIPFEYLRDALDCNGRCTRFI